jgi:TPR repeat protein/serine/threonine protein kinase
VKSIIGTMISDRYRIIKLLGEGADKRVYLSEDLRLFGSRRAVAVMVDSITDSEKQKSAALAFEREAEMLTRLKHTRIPQIFDRFSEGNVHYLVMEFVEGETLQAKLERVPGNRLPEPEAVSIAIKVLAVLDYLHRQTPPVIFRDLKPDNMMLRPDGELKLIDFGIARFFRPTGSNIGRGTVGYAAPEQYQGAIDARSDIYALGATLHHMLTGRDPAQHPFDFPPILKLVPNCDPNLAGCIDSALERDPARRPQSAAEFRDRIRAKSISQPSITPTGKGRNLAGDSAQAKRANAPTLLIAEVPCIRCQARIPAEAAFCTKCGHPNQLTAPVIADAEAFETQRTQPETDSKPSSPRYRRALVYVLGSVLCVVLLRWTFNVLKGNNLGTAAITGAAKAAPADPSAVSSHVNAESYPYEHSIVLDGTLVTSTSDASTFDEKPHAFPALQLDKPISAFCPAHDSSCSSDVDEPEMGVMLLQLAMSDSQLAEFEKHKGESVQVRGKLYHQITGHQLTKVLLSVEAIPLEAGSKPSVGGLSDADFDSRFQCPEFLSSDEQRKAALSEYMDWIAANHGDWTVSRVVDFRVQLLTRHHCVDTLRNIAVDNPPETNEAPRTVGTSIRGWLGVGMQTVTPELQQSLRLLNPEGVLVTRVDKDSPAAKARIEPHDVIVKYDGRSVTDERELGMLIGNTTVGKRVDVDLLRNGKQTTVTVLIEDVRIAAEQGNASAELLLGSMYFDGEGVERNYAEAFAWYQRAASDGLAEAENNLGASYLNGWGVEKDSRAAMVWFHKAAMQDSPAAEYNLGVMYFEDKRYDLALPWFLGAGGQGHARAQSNLGFMFEKGLGVRQDYAQALNWYRKAAAQGDASAQCNLGDMYFNGEGVKRDYSEAVGWSRKAAEQGFAEGQYALGVMYENGLGVARDHDQALTWYRKAAEQGNEDARMAVDRIASKTTG